jgi:uncharacterized membrane protein (DUF441 family)
MCACSRASPHADGKPSDLPKKQKSWGETAVIGPLENKMVARVGMILYWCGLTIASMCAIAAFTILVAILTNKLSDSEAWIAAVSFVVVGGLSWLAGRAAKNADI